MTGRLADASPRASRAASVAAALMSVCYAMALFQRTAFQAIGPTLRDEFALSSTADADLAAVFFWTYLVVMIPTGLLADAFGARRLAVGGGLVVGCGSLMFSAAESPDALTAARIVLSVGSAAAFVALMRFIALHFAERKATYSGRGILVGNLGAIASGAPLALLLAWAPWRTVWFALGVLSLALAFVLARVAPKAGQGTVGPLRVRGALTELLELLGSPSVWIGILLQAGLAGAFYAFANLIAPRWLGANGLARVDSGWAVSVLIAGYGIGAAFWGWIGDMERQRTRALALACGMALACWLGLAYEAVSVAAAVTPFMFAVGLSCGAFVLVYALIAERHPPERSGGVIACVNCGIPLGAAVIQSLAGRTPPDAAPLLLVAAAALAGGCALWLLRERIARARDGTA